MVLGVNGEGAVGGGLDVGKGRDHVARDLLKVRRARQGLSRGRTE